MMVYGVNMRFTQSWRDRNIPINIPNYRGVRLLKFFVVHVFYPFTLVGDDPI